MDIKIPDKWLREHLETNAKADDIARCLSLCGPSVEKVDATKHGIVYNIEVTGNRIDSASVYGIAREAAVILPKFGFKANLKPLPKINIKTSKKVGYLNTIVNSNLCPRFSMVLIKDVKVSDSPSDMIEKISACGGRGINNVVDISNYLMFEYGQPLHTFDYDKIKDSLMMLRQSKKGESIITLDGVKRTLPGGDMVIEDGSGKLIDLCGIMGGKLSAVDKNTKNVLVYVQSYNPSSVRRTSMSLAHRTDASVLFEKGLNPESVSLTLQESIRLFEKYTGGKAEPDILDIYPNPWKTKSIKLRLDNIFKVLGISIEEKEIKSILESLGFIVSGKNPMIVKIPSYRDNDISIEEDLIEEIARIYGYHNIPSQLMNTAIPTENRNVIFAFENYIKDIIKGYGGIEVYTLSLVSEKDITGKAYKLKNPLGKDTEYLRTSMQPSLMLAKNENRNSKEEYHLFEISNIYLPVENDLPQEKSMLAGIIENSDYRYAKGIVEALLTELNISYEFVEEEMPLFAPGMGLKIISGKEKLGIFGITEQGDYYYEFDTELLFNNYSVVGTYSSQTKFPSQIEDITFVLSEKTRIGNVISQISQCSREIVSVELKEIYENSFTFRIEYQSMEKTLQNKDVDKIRNKIISAIEKKFGGKVK